jgi:hypothetical protein
MTALARCVREKRAEHVSKPAPICAVAARCPAANSNATPEACVATGLDRGPSCPGPALCFDALYAGADSRRLSRRRLTL